MDAAAKGQATTRRRSNPGRRRELDRARIRRWTRDPVGPRPPVPTWSWEQDLGGGLTSGPTAISRGTGQLDVFWRSSVNGQIKHIWYPYSSDWSWEQDLGGLVDKQ